MNNWNHTRSSRRGSKPPCCDSDGDGTEDDDDEEGHGLEEDGEWTLLPDGTKQG